VTWRRTVPIVAGGGLALRALGLVIAARSPQSPAAQPSPGTPNASASSPRGAAGRPVPVATALARTGDVPVYVTGLGSVTPFYNVTVRTRVDGQLMSVPVAEGAFVKKDDVIAEIDPRPFEAAVTQMEGQLARDRALLDNAKLDLTRFQGLTDKDAVTKQQIDTQASLVAQLQGTVQSDEGQLANARVQLLYTRITAPIAGRVGLRLVDPGNIVHAADTTGLIVITQVQPIAVTFAIAEDMLPAILTRLHHGATLPVDAFNRDNTTHLSTGRLLTSDNQIDPTTGTVKLKAMFDNCGALAAPVPQKGAQRTAGRCEANGSGTLFPNQFVNARLTVDVLKQKVIVPPAAIRRGEQGTFVYVVRDDNTVHVRAVTVGITLPDAVGIDNGLKAGERVVTDGLDDLRDGSKVQVTASTSTSSSDAGEWGRQAPQKKERPPSSGGSGGMGRPE
jgi:membrane fusion protein, multidrug efflux system